jgi:hypothetical protein
MMKVEMNWDCSLRFYFDRLALDRHYNQLGSFTLTFILAIDSRTVT